MIVVVESSMIVVVEFVKPISTTKEQVFRTDTLFGLRDKVGTLTESSMIVVVEPSMIVVVEPSMIVVVEPSMILVVEPSTILVVEPSW